jgi:hypothetical protein
LQFFYSEHVSIIAMKSERSLNSLETVFAACNIRFALLVDFGEVYCPIDDIYLQVQEACRSCRLGHIALTCTDNRNEKAWKLVTDTSDEHTVHVVLKDTDTACVDLNDVGSFLDAMIHQETLPAQGPVSVQLIPYIDREKQVTQNKDNIHTNKKLILYVNGNHAICDGRSLTHFVAMATKALPNRPSGNFWKHHFLSDWKEWLEETKTDCWEDLPCFLQGPHDTAVLTIGELSQANPSTGMESLRLEISRDTLSRMRHVLKERAVGATLTGLIAATILHSIAKENKTQTPRDVGVSVLVDLRPLLPSIKDTHEVNQAHGTVTLMDSTDSYLVSSEDSTMIENVLTQSIAMTQQLQKRIQRGEAHRSALAATSGRFDEACPPATVELSNLGVCQIPEGAVLHTAQRYDGYNGVSCMVYSETKGCMRWNVSIGRDLDAMLVERIFHRAVNLCHEIAEMNGETHPS